MPFAGRLHKTEMPRIILIDREGKELTAEAKVGDSVLEFAHNNNYDIEGVCEGCMACSTCHVIIDPNWYSKLPPPSEDEEDMLDLTFGLTRTSRLGCQVMIVEEMDGLRITLPSKTRNMILD